VDRNRVAFMSLGMASCMAAMFDGDGGQVFGRDAEFMHIALSDQGIGGGNTDAEGALELWMAYLRERSDGAVARHAGQTIVSRNDKDMLTLTAGDQRSGLHNHDARAGAPGLNGRTEFWMNACIFAKDRAQHQVRFGERIRAQYAIDVARLKPGIANGAERSLRMQSHATGLRQFAYLSIIGAGNKGMHAHVRSPSGPVSFGQLNDSGCFCKKRATALSW